MRGFLDNTPSINQLHSEDPYNQYSTIFQDQAHADYFSSVNISLFSYLKLKNKIPLRQFLAGWLTTIVEKRAINRMLGMCSGKSIIDVPCGTGKLLPVFNKNDRSVFALDASAAMLSKAKNPDAEGVQFALSDIRYLPIRDYSVDIVISHRFLHRIPHEKYPATLCELFRISKKHVILYFSVKNIFTDIQVFFNIGDRDKIYYITKSAIKKEVEKCGFRFVKGIYVLPFLSTGFLVLAEKKNL